MQSECGLPGRARVVCSLWALALVASVVGCAPVTTIRGQEPEPHGPPSARQDNIAFRESVPTEKAKTTLATYVIEPPDILLLEAIKVVPKSPYRFEPLDTVQVLAPGAVAEVPLSNQYTLDPAGTIDLGPSWGGKVKLSGLTAEEARDQIIEQLKAYLVEPQVSVTLLAAAGQQQISDQHLVGPDGRVNLGTYGSVYVAGLTLVEARQAIENQLAKFLEEPKVSVDVFAYNSKVYYIISEGAGNGDTLTRVPITGNETVLDAISQVQGLTRFSSKNIWIARPSPGGATCDQVLPVNWKEITQGAATATNYQLLPGDRVFIAEDRLLAFDGVINRLTQPFERMFGFALLGIQTVQTANRFPFGFGGGNTF